MKMVLWKICLLFMSLLAAPIVKNSHIYARIYFIFLENFLKNLESLLIPNLISAKRSEKQLQTKANFSNCLQLNCSNFRLKLFERP